MTGGMAVWVRSLGPGGGAAATADHLPFAPAGTATAATILVLILASNRGGRLWRTACLGAAAGTSFGVTAALIKETGEKLSRDGVGGVVLTLENHSPPWLRIPGLIPRPTAPPHGPPVGPH